MIPVAPAEARASCRRTSARGHARGVFSLRAASARHGGLNAELAMTLLGAPSSRASGMECWPLPCFDQIAHK